MKTEEGVFMLANNNFIVAKTLVKIHVTVLLNKLSVRSKIHLELKSLLDLS